MSTQCISAGSLSYRLSHLPLPKDGYIVFPNRVANLISLAALVNEFRVLYNLSVDNAFYVFHNNGTYIKFTKQANGLYIYFVPDQANTSSSEHNLFLTVADEKAKYSTLDYKQAEKACDLQNCLCLHSNKDLICTIKNGIIKNPGITRPSV